ncbi:small multi-drug export protein [Pseudalkalibacillus berkeleyi]|uniref:Small multi-drug export protein n=1 Tax=Pseudalkalibacillus berkeleyi TaxID=1069813 RepID=A0ABS9H317_9BACL|nr:small multi-drug export protein [Pseudalkalibacillus berkeleyi]MCF6138461.1 small multi-drug export protein [Pseudalkalibacillus berkeleyi]
MFLSYLFVFILAAIPLFELVIVIPLAVIGGMSPLMTAILAFLGNALTVVLLIIFVDHVKEWMRKRKHKQNRMQHVKQEEYITTEANAEGMEESKKGKRARALFDKYGLPGLTIIGPFFVGSHISAFMGMSFGSNRKVVTSWMMTSLILWTMIMAVASSYGVTFFIPDVEEDGFVMRLFNN